jgi:hypothetical protein
MGCDIHMVLEKRTGDKWVAVNAFNRHSVLLRGKQYGGTLISTPAARSRNYLRFAALAGVRGDGLAPKGIPDDASDTALLLISEWGSDGHSHSWLPLEEAAHIFAETERWLEDDDEWHRSHPLEFFFCVESDDQVNSYRLIFWFDN